LETRTKRGFPHFHSDDDGGLLTATTPNPTKMGSYRFPHRTEKADLGHAVQEVGGRKPPKAVEEETAMTAHGGRNERNLAVGST